MHEDATATPFANQILVTHKTAFPLLSSPIKSPQFSPALKGVITAMQIIFLLKVRT